MSPTSLAPFEQIAFFYRERKMITWHDRIFIWMQLCRMISFEESLKVQNKYFKAKRILKTLELEIQKTLTDCIDFIIAI